MISSFDEAVLLLNKWKQEASQLCAISTFADATFRMGGTIEDVDADGTFLLHGPETDFLLVRPRDCNFGFDTSSLKLPIALAKLLPDQNQWDSLLCLGFQNGEKIILFSLK